MLSSECFAQGKENGIRCVSPLIHRQPHRARVRLKTVLEGRRQWSTNSPVPFMRFMQRDRNDRPLHGLIYVVRRPEEQLCQDRGGSHFLIVSDAPCFLQCPGRQICCVLSPCLQWWLINIYFFRVPELPLLQIFWTPSESRFLFPVAAQMYRGKSQQWQTLFSTQSHGLVTSAATSAFLKGNVIILLINRKSDRPICQEQASTAAVVLLGIFLLGFAKGSPGKGLLCVRHHPLLCWGTIGSHWGKRAGSSAQVGQSTMARAGEETRDF